MGIVIETPEGMIDTADSYRKRADLFAALIDGRGRRERSQLVRDLNPVDFRPIEDEFVDDTWNAWRATHAVRPRLDRHP